MVIFFKVFKYTQKYTPYANKFKVTCNAPEFEFPLRINKRVWLRLLKEGNVESQSGGMVWLIDFTCC